jgi:hypothetical protein
VNELLSAPKFLSIIKSVLVMFPGLSVFIIYLYFFIGIPKVPLVINNINSTQYAFYHPLTLLAVLGSVFFWSATWNNILRSLSITITI